MTQTPRIWLMLTPALAVVVLLFGGGVLLAGMQSVGYLPLIGRNTISFEAYQRIFGDPTFYRSLALTVWIGVGSTGMATLLAIGCALTLRRSFWGKRFVAFLFQLNLPIPHVVGAVGILLLFSQSGLVSRIAFAGGLIEETSQFPALVFDRFAIGVILQYVWKTTCFIGVILLAALQAAGDDFENVARTLGASRWQRFRYVTLPLLTPSILSSSILVFAFTFGAFEVPFLLGSRANSALPVLAYRRYLSDDLNARPEAMALSIVISLLITGLILVYMRLVGAVGNRGHDR